MTLKGGLFEPCILLCVNKYNLKLFFSGNEIILWQLLSHGADVHTKDCDGATPLHRAIDAGHDETSRMILDRGCSLDVADLDGDTALHLAVRKQNNEIVAVLLRKGANPDLKNSSGECPLHEAIRNELIPTAQLLLRGGCEVNIPGDFLNFFSYNKKYF